MRRRFLHRLFWRTAAVKPFFLRRFTPAGRLAAAALVVTAFFGLNTLMNMAYQGFTLLAALLAAAVVTGLRFRPQLEVTRSLPRFGSVGQPLSYPLRVKNRAGRSCRGVFLEEMLPDPRPDLDAFSTFREPLEGGRNRFDRVVGYYRWLWLTRKGRMAEGAAIDIPDLAPRGGAEIRVTLTPMSRGRLDLKGVLLARPDPLGLFRGLRRVPLPGSVLILPRRYPLPPVPLPGSRRHQPGGVSLASSVGDAEEFVSLREYRPGDPLRRIHWKSWARAGKPIVKEYQEEFFVRHALILDTFGRVPGDEPFEEAVSLAASFAADVRSRDSLLDLMFVGTEAYCFTSGRGLAHGDRMLEILAAARICTDKPFEAIYPLVMERAALMSGCILVLTAWDGPRRRLVRMLRDAGRPLRVFVIVGRGDRSELAPGPMETDPQNLIRLEAGAVEAGLARLDPRAGAREDG